MAYTQQVLHFAKIPKLKSLTDLDEIRFDEKPLTAILGPNGCGKSTILHALACCFKPVVNSNQPNHKFRDFFTPTTDTTWAGSKFSLNHTYRENQNSYPGSTAAYHKAADRWAPRYDRRPERHVVFIGIKSCVPMIEDETYTSVIRYQTDAHADDASNTVRNHMGTVFNRQYTELNTHRADGGKKYRGLAHNGTRYSSLSMGAGEQRVLGILTQVFDAPKYSLILVDEIDLLLHTEALKKLLRILSDRAILKSLQIVFTTHREAVLDLNDIISIKHICQAPTKTLCFSNTKPDAIQRLTGTQQRPLEIFVEDEMAKAIAELELNRLRIRRHASITKYGVATNLFTIAAGLALSNAQNFSEKLFLQDGDLFVNAGERQGRIDSILSGTEPITVARKAQILSCIRTLVSNARATPESVLHQMIVGLNPDEHPAQGELIQVARELQAVGDDHDFSKMVITRLDIEHLTGLAKIVEAASLSPNWEAYVHELRTWLLGKVAQVQEA